MQRSSNFELMRLVLMVFIMMHHFIYAMPYSVVSPELHAADTLFHTAVIDFVLLSGFFGIHFKVKGLLKLLFQVCFFSFFLTLFALCAFHNCSWIELIKSFMPISNGYYWFIAVYLQLYLLAPFINLLYGGLSNRQLILFLSVLSFLVFYVGMIRGGNICVDGKNVVNFVFIYSIGHGLRRMNDYILRNKDTIRIYSLITIALIIIGIYVARSYDFPYSNWVTSFTYRYHSPGLIVLSVCIFMLFQIYKCQNKVINRLSVSALAIYLFHEHPFMRDFLYKNYFSSQEGVGIFPIFPMLLYAFVLGFSAIVIDSVRLYLYTLAEPLFTKIDKRITSKYGVL